MDRKFHFGLTVSDLSRSVDFYRILLGAEPVKHAGFLDGIEISREDAEALIMQARVLAGWITAEELAKQSEEAEASEDQPAG